MSRVIDRTGERHGRLTVICEAPRDPKNRVRWYVRCDCGNEKAVLALSLGKSTFSCGCLQRERAAAVGAATGKDRTGERVGRLTILGPSPSRVGGRKAYVCVCDCGNETIVAGGSLREGGSTSCGCLRSERLSDSNSKRAKHGHTRVGATRKRDVSPNYYSWKSMIQRCRNPNAPNYHLYGGRGISVCDRWQGHDGFQNFLADMGERPDGKTLDRIDNDGNYEPGNCRWSDAKAQSNNRRETPDLAAARKVNLAKGRRHWPRKAVS